MLSNRLLNIVLVIALLAVVVFTFQEAAATSLISRANSMEAACSSLPSRNSIHTEYVKETGASVLYTEDGPTGLDGGLIQLLSDYRACSK